VLLERLLETTNLLPLLLQHALEIHITPLVLALDRLVHLLLLL
jgi:hypothetical protein